MKIKSGILGVGSYLPEKCVDNFYFEGIMDTSNEWITTRTGIKERRVAAEEEATSDLAIKASLKALECANLAPEDIDLIILATLAQVLYTLLLLQNSLRKTTLTKIFLLLDQKLVQEF